MIKSMNELTTVAFTIPLNFSVAKKSLHRNLVNPIAKKKPNESSESNGRRAHLK